MSKLGNPQQWHYSHANFNGKTTKVSLANTEIDAIDRLTVEGPSGNGGGAQLEHQDNGTILIRVDVRGNNTGVKVIDASGDEHIFSPA